MEVRATPHKKLQSAMEYLMTYGWAILVIAVVLGALYSLGVFNSTNFAPKAPPGSCHVFRPNGPGTSFDLNLEGVCNGELPEYVANFNGNGFTKQGNLLNGTSNFTIIAWIYPTQNSYGEIYAEGDGLWTLFFLVGNPLTLHVWNVHSTPSWWVVSPSNILAPINKWSMITVVLSNGGPDTGTATFYLNGATPYTANAQDENYTGGAPLSSLIGGSYNGSRLEGSYTGNLANVQVYNTALSASEIQALYQEGIGGAPIDLQNLVGWWPLNGNANDYSGNGNNGVPINVTFVSNWYSG
ncbi:MAG: LamG domain-containing protein, partial [Candidatus Micrarchaeaceae archaeon]